MADEKKQNGFKSFLQHALPFISAGLSVAGPLGGVAGKILAGALGSEEIPSCLPDAEKMYAEAMLKAGGSADLIERAQAAEREFKLQMEKMGIDSVEKILELENADRANARGREIAVGDKTTQIGFYCLTALVALLIFSLLKFTIPAENKAVIFTLTGAAGAAWQSAVNYFFGSSRGSDRKTELLSH